MQILTTSPASPSRLAALAALLTPVLLLPTSAHAVIGGQATRHAEWPAVVGLMYDLGDGLEPGCTGTVIAPRVVLTAAHCVAHRDGVSDADPVAVRLGTSDLARGGRDVAVREIRAMSNGLDGFDIALLLLAEDAGVAPAPLARGCGAATQDGQVTLVGFGVTDRETFGELHRVDLRVAELACTDPDLGCNDHQGQGAYLVTTPGGMCGGDSGGPIFVVNQHGRFVAGVVSGPAQDEASDLCDDWRRALYPRPDTVATWIEAQLGHALPTSSCEGGSRPPAPTPAEPEPDTGSDAELSQDGEIGCSVALGPSDLALTLVALVLAWGWLRVPREAPRAT